MEADGLVLLVDFATDVTDPAFHQFCHLYQFVYPIDGSGSEPTLCRVFEPGDRLADFNKRVDQIRGYYRG